MLFVHQGTGEDAAEVFASFWPEARRVSDPSLELYTAFGVGRAGIGKLFGLGVIKRSFQARRKGYRQGKVQGDPWILPGAFLVRNGQVVWMHDFAHAGDEIDHDGLRRALGETAGAT